MDELSNYIDLLEHKVEQLIGAYRLQSQLVQQLREENKQLKQGRIGQDFQSRAKISTITKKITERGREVVAFKDEINQYIKDIDKCITTL